MGLWVRRVCAWGGPAGCTHTCGPAVVQVEAVEVQRRGEDLHGHRGEQLRERVGAALGVTHAVLHPLRGGYQDGGWQIKLRVATGGETCTHTHL